MTTLEEELSADQIRPTKGCSLCNWLETLEPQDQAEWDAALAKKRYTDASVVRAVKRRGGHIGKMTPANHRNGGHRQ